MILTLNFFVYFGEMSSYISTKASKRKVRKCLKCVKEFSGRFDVANGKKENGQRNNMIQSKKYLLMSLAQNIILRHEK